MKKLNLSVSDLVRRGVDALSAVFLHCEHP
jgi:hypothetical protein